MRRTSSAVAFPKPLFMITNRPSRVINALVPAVYLVIFLFCVPRRSCSRHHLSHMYFLLGRKSNRNETKGQHNLVKLWMLFFVTSGILMSLAVRRKTHSHISCVLLAHPCVCVTLAMFVVVLFIPAFYFRIFLFESVYTCQGEEQMDQTYISTDGR